MHVCVFQFVSADMIQWHRGFGVDWLVQRFFKIYILFLFCLRRGFPCVVQLFWKLLCSLSWPQVCSSPLASASRMLELYESATSVGVISTVSHVYAHVCQVSPLMMLHLLYRGRVCLNQNSSPAPLASSPALISLVLGLQAGGHIHLPYLTLT